MRETVIEEPRKIVLVLGNGFDLDLGLKTSYKDFWESDYCPKNYPAPIIKHLNEHLGNDVEIVRWYDLENEFFYYYNKIEENRNKDVLSNSELSFLKVVDPYKWSFRIYEKYVNEVESLLDKGYLSLEKNSRIMKIPYLEDMRQPPVWRDRKAVQLIKEGLCAYLLTLNYEVYSEDSVAPYVYYAINNARTDNSIVDIYSFNYTKVPYSEENQYRNHVFYVHGNCSKGRIIIGTKDYGNYNKDYDFLQKSFDSHFSPPNLVMALLNADEVVFFGHSIGENDRQYFKAFFKQQTDYSRPNEKEITFFTLDDESELEIKRALQNMTDNNFSALCSMNKVRIFKTKTLKDNADLFREFLSEYIKDGLEIHYIMSKLGL